MSKKPSLMQRIGHWGLLPMALVGFALVASFLLSLLLGNGIFVSAVYALFTVSMTVIIVLGAVKVLIAASEDIESFMRPSHALSLEERRKEARQKLDRMREDLLFVQAKKNRVDFYTKAAIVLAFLAIYTWVMQAVYHVYPAQAFLVPLWALVILWFISLRFLNRAMVILVLLALAGIAAVVSVMGPVILLQMLPYFLTMPLFMFMNFFILFGPLMFFNIQQIQIVKPGEGEWMITFDEVRGQDEAKRQILSDLGTFLYSGKDDPLMREKGILMVGPPGVGKTLTAKAIATHLNCPVVLTTGSAFISTFIGVGIFVMLYLKWRVESLAVEFGRCVLFIDEAEQLLMRRAGVQTGDSGNVAPSFYGTMKHNSFGEVGDLVFDSQESHALTWKEKYPERYKAPDNHPVIAGAGMFGGFGGAQMTLPVYLNWMDGVPTPPMLERLWRSTANWMLDIFFVPPLLRMGKKVIHLRIARPKPVEKTVLHIAATNMPGVIDPAMTRPGRFGRVVQFVLPGEEERADVADLYFGKAAERDLLHPDLRTPEKIREFAQAAVGLSPAQIMQVVFSAPALTKAHIVRLNELTEMKNRGETLNDRDQRFLNRFGHEIGQPNWDKPWATWDSLMESLRAIRYGLARPTRTSPKHRETTAVHELAGHLLPLRAFAGEAMKPTILSIMPRGQALGMVAHVPIQEHDPQPQRFWEGMLRVMVGSVVAERLFFKDNQPGVISDLESATLAASAMVGKFGMVPRKCSNEEKEKYQKIGRSLLSEGPSELSLFVQGPASRGKEQETCLLLGQAFVDTYRTISKNRDLVPAVVERLLAEDEVMGKDLDELWEKLGREMKPLDQSDMSLWPDDLIEPANPFYQEVAK